MTLPAQSDLDTPATSSPAWLQEPAAAHPILGECSQGRRAAAFLFFLSTTAVLFIRPADLLPELADLPIYEILILACLAAAMPEVLDQLKPHSLAGAPITLCVVGILAAIALSHASHFQFAETWTDGIEFTKVLLYYLLLVAVIDTAARLRQFLACLALCIAMLAAIPLLQHHGLIDLGTVEALDERSVDHNSGQEVIFTRLQGAGLFHDPNDLCHILGTGVLLCLAGFDTGHSRALRALWAVPLAMLLWAMVLTQSRGGVLALGAGLAAWGLMRFGWKKSLVVGAIVAPALLSLMSGRQTDISLETETGQERIQLWSDALDLFHANPVLGVGEGSFEKATGLVVHNSFVQCFVELGWVGGTCFLGAFYLALRILLSQPIPSAFAPLRPYMAAAIGAYVVGMMSLTRSYFVPTYLMLGMATAYSRAAPAAGGAAGARVSGRLLRELAAVSIIFLVLAHFWVRASVHWQ